jgi:hypothetical protein
MRKISEAAEIFRRRDFYVQASEFIKRKWKKKV